MKITKKEIQESASLFKSLQEAKAIDITDVISPIEKRILELDKFYQHEKTLRHNSEAHVYQNQITLLFSQIETLQSEKHQKIEAAISNFDKFHRPFKNQFIERLTFLYGKTEQEFLFNVINSEEGMFTRFHKIKTNAILILETLKSISEELVWFRETRSPLSEQTQRLENFEKNLATDFPEKVYSVIGDIELLQLKGFFTDPTSYDDVEFKPLVYGSEVIENKIRLIQAVLK